MPGCGFRPQGEDATLPDNMCNLYSMTTNQQAIRDLGRAMRNEAGNLPPLPGIFPDQSAPVVRTGADGVRELARARWGMPSPAFALAGRKVDRGVTNVRNTDSPHWRRWLAPPSRCLVPFTSFSESVRRADGKSEPVWFALGPEPSAGVLRRDLDGVDLHPEGRRGRGDLRPLRIPDH